MATSIFFLYPNTSSTMTHTHSEEGGGGGRGGGEGLRLHSHNSLYNAFVQEVISVHAGSKINTLRTFKSS